MRAELVPDLSAAVTHLSSAESHVGTAYVCLAPVSKPLADEAYLAWARITQANHRVRCALAALDGSGL